MTSKFIRISLIGLIAFVHSACQTQTAEPAPEFLVDGRQSQELTQIVRSVRQQLSRMKYVSLTEEKVVDELSGYDARIKTMLSDEQWVHYDTHQRKYWVERIYAGLKKDLRERDMPAPKIGGRGMDGATGGDTGAFASEGSASDGDRDDR